MSRLTALLSGVWDFVVGDDWRTALGAALAIALTALAAQAGIAAWWIMALAVPALLALSIRRAARAARLTPMTSSAPPWRRPVPLAACARTRRSRPR